MLTLEKEKGNMVIRLGHTKDRVLHPGDGALTSAVLST